MDADEPAALSTATVSASADAQGVTMMSHTARAIVRLFGVSQSFI
ncbi:hypothetical protein [Caballeronia choica]|nr:hypothetical protein [Caballeronia choica]